MPWIVVTMISLIYNVIEVVGIIILPPMVAQAAPNLLYIFATEATGYFGLVGLTIYIYIFIVVWSFRFLVHLPKSYSLFVQMKGRLVSWENEKTSQWQLKNIFQETASGVIQREATFGEPVQRPRWKGLRTWQTMCRRQISFPFMF